MKIIQVLFFIYEQSVTKIKQAKSEVHTCKYLLIFPNRDKHTLRQHYIDTISSIIYRLLVFCEHW